MKRNYLLIALGLLLVVGLTGCGSPNPDITSQGAGFWNGLWDGLTAEIAFVANLFGGHYNIYEVVNNGGWYNFGFLLGIGGPLVTLS